MPASWQLPPGVSRGLWDYVHDADLAAAYDAQLADTPLLRVDQDFVLEHCRPAGRVIDLGCGTGRLGLTLAQRGYRVLGVDLSEAMLRVAGDKARRAGVVVERLQANLVELDCVADACFDYAVCLFGTLGMIAGAEPRRRFLGHVVRILRPGGVLALHVHNRWFHLGTRAGRRLLLGNWWQSRRGRATPGDFEMPPYQGLASMPMHLFGRREISRLLREVGFDVIDVRPVSLRADGRLAAPRWFASVRSYGYLIAGRKR